MRAPCPARFPSAEPFIPARTARCPRRPISTTLPPETALGALLLAVTLGLGAYWDWRQREVDDRLWLGAGVVGIVLGAVVESGRGLAPLLLWLVVGGFVLQHVVPWDVPIERRSDAAPGIIEAAMYVGVTLVLLLSGLTLRIGPTGLPVEVIAVYLSVLIARALFEFGVLYGGADAKAIMVAGLIVPLDMAPLVSLPSTATAILGFYPFTLTLLMDAALLAVVVPLGLAVRNALHGGFGGIRGFTGYRLPVRELPNRFVWLRDPTFHIDPESDVATTEEDVALRTRQARELERQGVREVWVTPQLPFIVFLFAGALAALAVGNLLFDLFALL
ncbi:MAG TPA: A24 family peptidase C-terminal domain-containing protein [Thermoplasmata archaeon]|nr:A24 family peptidase C-terminal domain-containing protein [Thermoplasmata archaeon]